MQKKILPYYLLTVHVSVFQQSPFDAAQEFPVYFVAFSFLDMVQIILIVVVYILTSAP